MRSTSTRSPASRSARSSTSLRPRRRRKRPLTPPRRPRPRQRSRSPASLGGMRLLVVEDEPEVSAFLLRVLREAAWAADVARTGAQVLKALASLEYDLVILDLGLPDIDGFEVCRVMRGRGDRTPVLVLTARDAGNDRGPGPPRGRGGPRG